MASFLDLPWSPLEESDHPIAAAAGVQLNVKRDDLYSPAPGTALQGNKVRKLALLFDGIGLLPFTPLLVSFGGAYSNHLAALATAGKLHQVPVVLYVRGEEVDNPLLRQAAADGAVLKRISRSEYRLKHTAEWQEKRRQELAEQFPENAANIWFIPEGGTTQQAVKAMQALSFEIQLQQRRAPDYLCVSAGTGGTAAGIILGAHPHTRVEVFPALKGSWMTAEIKKWLPENHPVRWSCISGYDFGGYGKFPAEWIVDGPGLAKQASIGPGLPPLEPVYTAKLFSGVLDRIEKGYYPRGSTIVVVHTGGIY